MQIDLNQTISKDMSNQAKIDITCKVTNGRVILYLKEWVMVNNVQTLLDRGNKDVNANNSPAKFSGVSKSNNGTGKWQLQILGQVNGTVFSLSGDVKVGTS